MQSWLKFLLLYFQIFLNEAFLHSGVYVGQNFRFGKGRAGDSSLLREIAVKAGLKVNIVESINCDSLPVSSSRQCEALSLGNIKQVNQMLGRDYSIFGIVSSGKGMGRKIAFPL